MKTLHIYPTGVGYHITTALVLTFLFGLTISNSAYFSRVATTPNVSVSKGTLETMTTLNVIVSIASGLMLLWSAFRIGVSHESKHKTMHDEYTKLTKLEPHPVDHHHHHHHQHKAPNIHTHNSKPTRSAPHPKLPAVF